MKTKIVALILAALGIANAAEALKTPNHGRLIDAVESPTEFLVTPEKKIEIRFLDKAGKVIAPTGQVVTVSMGDRSNPTKLTFKQDGDKIVSEQTIAVGDNLPLVLQIRAKEGAKAVTQKFNLNFVICPTCKNAEYACSCDHHH
jgi:hypothetical protein